MFPWEHVVVGYVTFSLLSRVLYRQPPSDLAAVAVVFGSLLPDLVDKPLAWQFGVFETSYGLAHSVLFAVPVCAAVWAVARWRGRAPAGAGLTTGYLLHLPADVLAYWVIRGRWSPERILWPYRKADPTTATDFGSHLLVYVGPYLEELLSGDGSTYLLANLVLAVLAFLLWIVDGRPGPGAVAEAVRGVGRRVAG